MARGGKRPGAGRPKGAQNKVAADIKALAQEHGPAAIKALVRALDDPNRSVQAATALLDRGYGKAPQALEHTGKDGGPIESKNTSDTELARKLAFLLTKDADTK